MTGGYNNKNYDRWVKKNIYIYFRGVRRSHYFGGVRRSHYFGGIRRSHSDSIRQSYYFGGSAIGPPPQAAPLAEPPVLVVYLKYKFKLKKYNH